jgi:hypothetical protein
LLGVEVVEARLEARQPLLAALRRELPLLEGLVVALERALGAGDFGADRAKALLDLGPVAFRFCLCSRDRLGDQVAVAVGAGELGEDCLFELCAGEAVALRQAFGPYFWRPVQA